MSETDFVQRNLGQKATEAMRLVAGDPDYSRYTIYYGFVDVQGDKWRFVVHFYQSSLQDIYVHNDDRDLGHDDITVPNNNHSFNLSRGNCDEKFNEMAVDLAKKYKKFDGPPKVKVDSSITSHTATMTFSDRSLVLDQATSELGCYLQVVYALPKIKKASPF